MTSGKPLHRISSKVKNSQAYTLMEMLVAVVLLGVTILSIASATSSAYSTLSFETQAAESSMQARYILHSLLAEVRMAGILSPYFGGINSALEMCPNQVEISTDGNDIRFFVSHDSVSQSAGRGQQLWYVGYRFNPAKNELVRGQILMNNPPSRQSDGTCNTPATDPLNSALLMTSRIRAPEINNGKVFTIENNALSIAFQIEVKNQTNNPRLIPFQSSVGMRRKTV
jgi:competence protein ComGF